MSYKNAVKIVFFVSIAGVLFSGYLSYLELFTSTGCAVSPVSCGESGFTIATLPACVYGLFMYCLILIITSVTLIKNKADK
ncbi:hypothetical protein GF357_03365 [Candidatus Dojkabacteria bacterium]|nr:hypothetical protein [Candidatus Dojkabacteria bacterium]